MDSSSIMIGILAGIILSVLLVLLYSRSGKEEFGSVTESLFTAPVPVVPMPMTVQTGELVVPNTGGLVLQGGTSNYLRVAGTATTTATTNAVGTTANQIQIYNAGNLTAAFDVDGLYVKALNVTGDSFLSKAVTINTNGLTVNTNYNLYVPSGIQGGLNVFGGTIGLNGATTISSTLNVNGGAISISGGTSSLRLVNDGGINYIESGNNTFTASADLYITGNYLNKLNNLILSANTVQAYGDIKTTGAITSSGGGISVNGNLDLNGNDVIARNIKVTGTILSPDTNKGINVTNSGISIIGNLSVTGSISSTPQKWVFYTIIWGTTENTCNCPAGLYLWFVINGNSILNQGYFDGSSSYNSSSNGVGVSITNTLVTLTNSLLSTPVFIMYKIC